MNAALFKNRTFRVGAALVLAVVLFALLYPLVSAHDPYVSDFTRGVDRGGLPAAPSSTFLAGTDRIFRDQMVRLALGARTSLFVAVLSTILATAIGGFVGVISGFVEGRPRLGLLDAALMRLLDIGLAFPFLLLVMAVGIAFDRTTVTTLVVLLGGSSWLGTARVVRAKTMQVRALEFVTASRALGQNVVKLLILHVVPNVAGPIVVLATSAVAQMIVAEGVLGYLGAGLPQPRPSLGYMLAEGQIYMAHAPWLLACPAALLVLAVLGFNLMGEGMRDALDPKR